MKQTLGRKDRCDFPSLNLKSIAVKTDTGAYTSSIHCTKIKEEIDENNEKRLRFVLLDPSHPEYENMPLYADKFSKKDVKSSNGQIETRYIVEASVKLFEKTYPIQLSLTDRGNMKYPVLIGRKFLMGKFKVDVSKYDLSYKYLKRKAKKSTG